MLKQLLRSVTGTDSAEATGGRSGRVPDREGDGTDEDAAAATGVDLTADRLVPAEDRVLRLLEDGGGRAWQQDVVARTEFSAGRVSQLLTEMEADGQITRRWQNGEKVVALAESGDE